MDINGTGYVSREIAPNRADLEQELAQRARENDDNEQRTQKAQEPRPPEQVSSDKQGRIDIYA